MSKTWRKVRGLGWLSLPVAVLVLLAILWLTWATPVSAQPTWESYDDDIQSNVWGTVADPYDASHTVVYMYGTGFTKNLRYNIGYYDNGGVLRATDDRVKVPPQSLDLTSEYDIFVGGVGTPGTWHCSAYLDPLTPPGTYDGLGVVNDDFEVLPGAIPEFPTVLSAISVATLCGVAYLWMRKKTGYAQP